MWTSARSWVLTLPAAAAVGGGAFVAADAIRRGAGVAVVGVGGLVPIALLYARARRNRVDATNVNDEWSGSLTPARGPHDRPCAGAGEKVTGS